MERLAAEMVALAVVGVDVTGIGEGPRRGIPGGVRRVPLLSDGWFYALPVPRLRLIAISSESARQTSPRSPASTQGGRAIYSLRWDTAVYPVFKALPERTAHAFGAALVEAQADPLAHASPYGHDDGTMRMLMVGRVLAVLLIGDQSKSITVIQINHVG